MRRAASRAACTAGNSNPTKTPMIAMTTNSSTNVNPWLFIFEFFDKFQSRFRILIFIG
jgi:hypothetical protein